MKSQMRLIKIIGIVSASLIIMVYISKNVFLSNTPKLNPQFITSVKNLPGNIYLALSNIYKNSIARGQKINPVAKKKLDQKAIDAIAKTIPLKSVATGVYAGEDKLNQVGVIQIDEKSSWEIVREKQADGTIQTIIRLKK